VAVLDTQVYSNTGGQACTSGFLGQVSDMATYGKAQHGKKEPRKELGLIAIAHRTSFVVQTSQAVPAHLLGSILRGLASRRPAVFNIYCPCQTEHGIPDSASEGNAKLALESRAYPYFVYDPDGGEWLADRLDLDGNPSVDQEWPTYELKYKDENGKDQVMELPVTVADWAATEVRFARHFRRINPEKLPGELVLYHEYLKLSPEEAEGKVPFIYTLKNDGRLDRLEVSQEIVALGRERLDFWRELREMAGELIPESVREQLAAEKEAEFEERLNQIKAEYEAEIERLKQTYPQDIARRMAEALVGQSTSLGSLLSSVTSAAPSAAALGGNGPQKQSTAQPSKPAPAPTQAASATAVAEAEEKEAELVMGPWIDEDLCTACDDCQKVNPKLFVYGSNGKMTISDPKNGTYKDLVVAAERCPAGAIHPGLPLNKNERDLNKWIERAKPFNE
ncbi:MAG TPA: ferredoxin, partial [Acidobacteriota bacterium]|nr:ferredoxin [Acidobacteriota bacterium]